MDKTFSEAINGIRSAVMASEVREDIAQGMEYVEQFANTATTKAEEAAASAKTAADAAGNASTAVSAAIDPTLSVSGKAADAAKVGEAINAETTRAKEAEEENAKGVSQLKENISDFNDTVLSEVSNNLTKTIALSQNKGIDANDPFMDDFPIKNGAVCKLMITGLNGAVIDTFAAVFYYLSSDGSIILFSSIE